MAKPFSADMKARLSGQVKRAFEKSSGSDLPVAKTSSRTRLDDILAQADWWKLYISPIDHEDAVAKSKNDPGFIYDLQQSKGFKKAMVDVYTRCLVNGAGPTAATIEWTSYKQLYVDIVKDVTPSAGGEFGSRDVEVKASIESHGKNIANLPTSPTLGDGVAAETVLDKHLVWDVLEGHQDAYTTKYSTPQSKESEFVIEASIRGAELVKVCNAVFDVFRDDIKKARTRLDQLVAIARMTRNLHILHPFKDGNKRLHAYLVLPLMLLEYGFGLPLKRDVNGEHIDVAAMNEMFNGGYSSAQGAQFLWVSQEFGEQERKKRKEAPVRDDIQQEAKVPNRGK